MKSATNSIRFLAEGTNNKADVDIKVTEKDGSLFFELQVVNPQSNHAALHSLYFDLNGFVLGDASTFKITGQHIVSPLVEADAVSSKTTDIGNGNGHFTKEFFDVGITFPQIGNGQSELFSTSFTLADTSGRPLTLGLIGGQAFGIRLTSPDDKIEAVSAQAPVNSPPALLVVTLADGTEDEIYTLRAADLIKEAWDSDGDPLSVTAVSVKSGGGSVTQTADGVWTYTPAPNSHGPVVLQYSVFDGKVTVTLFASLNLKEVNDAPIAAPEGNFAAGDEDQVLSGMIPAGDDPDADPVTYELVSSVTGLTLASDGTFTYQPVANAHGNVTFQYRVFVSTGAKSDPQTFAL